MRWWASPPGPASQAPTALGAHGSGEEAPTSLWPKPEHISPIFPAGPVLLACVPPPSCEQARRMAVHCLSPDNPSDTARVTLNLPLRVTALPQHWQCHLGLEGTNSPTGTGKNRQSNCISFETIVGRDLPLLCGIASAVSCRTTIPFLLNI